MAVATQSRPSEWASRRVAVTVDVALPMVVTALVGGAAWVGSQVDLSPGWHRAALLVHLAFLVVGLGAVLVVDWSGLLWLVGRIPFAEVMRTAATTTPLTWIGYTGLVMSGSLLSPHLDASTTQLKVALVLVLGWTGLLARDLHRRLGSTTSVPTVRQFFISAGAALLSQVCWWTATVIGFLSATTPHA